jgi:hypothetical protein
MIQYAAPETGKASTAPRTAATVKEIVSYLASCGKPNFPDLDD